MVLLLQLCMQVEIDSKPQYSFAKILRIEPCEPNDYLACSLNPKALVAGRQIGYSVLHKSGGFRAYVHLQLGEMPQG
jgi:hypothetical protein